MSTRDTAPGTAAQRTPEEIQADVELQRRQLADTVDELGRRLDVKSRARERPELLAAAGSLVVVAVAVLVWRRHRTH